MGDVNHQWLLLGLYTPAPLRLLVNINERCMLYKRPYLFSYLLTEPQNWRWTSINITLPHPQSCALFLLGVNDVYSCACGGRPLLWTAAIAHDGAGPQARTQLASQTTRHLLGVGWAMALKCPAACSDLLLDTSRFFSSTPPSPTKNSILQAECKLNQSWHAERPWVGWRSCHRCVYVFVCAYCGILKAMGNAFCLIINVVKGYRKHTGITTSLEAAGRHCDANEPCGWL